MLPKLWCNLLYLAHPPPPPPPPPAAALCCLAFNFISRRRPSRTFSRWVSRSNTYKVSQQNVKKSIGFWFFFSALTVVMFCFSFGCSVLRKLDSSSRVMSPVLEPHANSLPWSWQRIEWRLSSLTWIERERERLLKLIAIRANEKNYAKLSFIGKIANNIIITVITIHHLIKTYY